MPISKEKLIQIVTTNINYKKKNFQKIREWLLEKNVQIK